MRHPERDDARTAAAHQLRELGHAPLPAEDPPRWHLAAAEEAMDAGEWEVARIAVERARETLEPGSPEELEAGLAALRLAVSTVDLPGATAEALALAARMSPADEGRNRRARALVAAAPAAFTASLRTGITALLPPLPGVPATAAGSLDALDRGPCTAGEDTGENGSAVSEVSTDSRAPDSASNGGAPNRSRWHLRVGDADLLAAADLRDRLVEQMLATVREDEFEVLFETATTFLATAQYAAAEVLFSAVMVSPALRVAACEGLMQALVAAGRHLDAVATGTQAERVFAGGHEPLLGIVYWRGVAAQELGEGATAHACFDRVIAGGARAAFPDVERRRRAAG